MTAVRVRVCILLLILNIAIEFNGFGKADTPKSVNAPGEDPSKGLKVTSCGNNNLGKVLSVYLTGCNNPPCIFRRGQKNNFFLQFSPNEDYSSLYASFEASVSGLKSPLDSISGDICNKLLDDKKCPLKKGETYIYHCESATDKLIPPAVAQLIGDAAVELDINLELKDPVNGNKLCVVLASEIK